MTAQPKALIVLAGLPLTGKTTIGNALQSQYGAQFFDVDVSRREIDQSDSWLGPEKEKQIMLAAYERNHQKAIAALQSGKTAVVAATYSRTSYHDSVREIARKTNSKLYVFLLQLPLDQVKLRLNDRLANDSDSNIKSIESYQEVSDRYVPFAGDELSMIDASLSVDTIVEQIHTRVTG